MIYREFGSPEVLHYEDLPEPVPGPGEITLEVHACSVNRVLDVAVRAGKQPQRKVQLPHVGGVDPVGIVTAVGPGVTDRKIGDVVAVFQGLGERKMFGIHCWGGNAQFTKAPVFATCVVPKGVSYADACVLARHAPVAWNLLVTMGKLKTGEFVLVIAPPTALALASEDDADALLRAALARTSLKDAVGEVAVATGLPRRTLYQRALALTEEKDREAE